MFYGWILISEKKENDFWLFILDIWDMEIAISDFPLLLFPQAF